jgi:hypothetical protein
MGRFYLEEKVLAEEILFFLKGGETVYLQEGNGLSESSRHFFLLEVDGFNGRKETVLSERRRWFFL